MHAIAQDSGTEPNAPTCELLRSADDITQTDFYRFGTRGGLGRTLYISCASVIPSWWFDRFRGPWLQSGHINSERTPETHVPADRNRYTDADEHKNYDCASRSLHKTYLTAVAERMFQPHVVLDETG